MKLMTKMGRPSLSDRFPTIAISLRIPRDIWTVFRARCEKENKTASQVVRELIETYLQSK